MELYLDDYYGNSFHLHSIIGRLPTVAKRPIEGLEGGAPRITVYDNPGEAGQTVSNILPGASLITIPGSLRSLSGNTDQERINDYETSRLNFLNAIRYQYASGRPLPMTLRIVQPSGTEYQATVYRHNFKAPHEYTTYGTWLLELLNPKGVIESATMSSVTLTLPQPGGVVYPVVYPIVYGSTSGGSAVATNYGNMAAKPVITFYGPLDNPVLTNDAVGKFIKLNLTIASGQRVVVNVSTPSIVEGTLTTTTSTNRMGSRATGSSFWKIEPGANPLRLRASTYDVGYATLDWRNSWEAI